MAGSEWQVAIDFVEPLLILQVVDFYNQINLLYGSITEFCSPQTCPEMKATDEYASSVPVWKLLIKTRFEYLWQDNEDFKRPTKMPAPEYVEHLMGWVQSNIDNEQMFPSRIGQFNTLIIRSTALNLPQACHSQRHSHP